MKPNELAMANMPIEALKAEFEPEKYHDTYRDNLMRMIEAKKEGQKVVETPEPRVAPVIDIMEAQLGREEKAGAGGCRGRRAGGQEARAAVAV